jgi:AraC-like DNA-binding protein
MTQTRMTDAPPNLVYLAKGARTYGLRPVLGRPRGYWELQWVFKGGARPDNLALTEAEARSPRLHLAHPDSPHGWTDDGDGVAEVFVLHFRTVPPELADQVNMAGTRMLCLADTERRHFTARLADVADLAGAADSRLKLKLEQILIEVALLVLTRATPPPTRRPTGDRVEQALHWFKENIAENPSTAEVARAVGVSPAHLRRLFADAGQDAPRTEMSRLRMAAVQRCLREGWKLEKIAANLGFSEASAVSRAFAQVCGTSARQWLNRWVAGDSAATAARAGNRPPGSSGRPAGLSPTR